MTDGYFNSFHNPKPYIPATLGEIYDLLGSMYLGAPTFIDRGGHFTDQDIESEFHALVESFGAVRKKVGEARYARLIELAARAKALFAADSEDENGKSDEGRALLLEIEDLIQEVRRRRVRDKLPDDEGEVSGD
jgi:hypothetical protein